MPRPTLYLDRWRALKELARARGGVVTLTQRQLARELGVSRRWIISFLEYVATFESVAVTQTKGRFSATTIVFKNRFCAIDRVVRPSMVQKRNVPAATEKSVNGANTGLVIGPPMAQKLQAPVETEEKHHSGRNGSMVQKHVSMAQKPHLNGAKTSKCAIGNVLKFPRKSSPTRTRASAQARALKTHREEQSSANPSLRSGAPSARVSSDSNLKLALAMERGELPRSKVLGFYRFRSSRSKTQWDAVVEGATRRLTAAYIARKSIATGKPKQLVAAAHEKHLPVFRRAALLALELLVEDERFTVDRLLDVAWDTKGAKYIAPIPNFLASPTMADKVREWMPPEDRMEDDPNYREIRKLADMTPEERARHDERGRRFWWRYANLPMADIPPDDCDTDEKLSRFYEGEARRLWSEGRTQLDDIPADVRARIVGKLAQGSR